MTARRLGNRRYASWIDGQVRSRPGGPVTGRHVSDAASAAGQVELLCWRMGHDVHAAQPQLAGDRTHVVHECAADALPLQPVGYYQPGEFAFAFGS
jgi:hypothetical protein